MSSWNVSSRVHPLNHFPDEGVSCYVKRDDELGCGISGSKLRKYASLVPFFVAQQIAHLVIIAGPQSNNLLAAVQVARELGLGLTVFLIKPWKLELKGNFKLSSLFLDEKDIIWVARDEWSQVEQRAKIYCEKLKVRSFVLTEGASVPEAMEGALSLAQDIIANELVLGLKFQHIFVDAGTGFSAAALVRGLHQLNHQGLIHILLLADSEALFNEKLVQWIGSRPNNYRCFSPLTAKAFGSVNQTVKNEVKRMACEEGILADPIYAAKLFHEARGYIVAQKLQGKVLIIHSGGTLTMPAFDF